MTVNPRHLAKVVETLLKVRSARRVTYIVRPDFTICAALQRPLRGRVRSTSIVLTLGKPNFASRRLIRLAKQAGEPFPIKKLQFYPLK